jgi:hypothetical protein
MKASCLRRRHSRRTAHVICQYLDPFPLERWQRRACSGICLVAAPKPRPTPLVLHRGAHDGDDRRAASMAFRSRGRNRWRGGSVPLAVVARMVRAARPPKPPPPRRPRPPPRIPVYVRHDRAGRPGPPPRADRARKAKLAKLLRNLTSALRSRRRRWVHSHGER